MRSADCWMASSRTGSVRSLVRNTFYKITCQECNVFSGPVRSLELCLPTLTSFSCDGWMRRPTLSQDSAMDEGANDSNSATTSCSFMLPLVLTVEQQSCMCELKGKWHGTRFLPITATASLQNLQIRLWRIIHDNDNSSFSQDYSLAGWRRMFCRKNNYLWDLKLERNSHTLKFFVGRHCWCEIVRGFFWAEMNRRNHLK